MTLPLSPKDPFNHEGTNQNPLIQQLLSSPNAKKMTFELVSQLDQLPKEINSSDIIFVIFIRGSALRVDTDRNMLDKGEKSVEGVSLNQIAGDIYTARVSLKGLLSVINDDRVTSVQGSQRLYPSGPKP